MAIVIPDTLPAYSILKSENILVMSARRAKSQDIRPLEIAILNLMPFKAVTETQLMRLLSNSPLQVNVTLLSTESYVGRHTPIEHLDRFYKSFSDISDRNYDGMIVTGAPVEDIEFKDVAYWKEITSIFDYTKKHVTSTIFICWSALAALNYFYGVEKIPLKEKLFGVYQHRKMTIGEKLLKGTDDAFCMPHSIRSAVREHDIASNSNLELIASSQIAGPGIIKSVDERSIFILGHVEYDRDTLDSEYKRDLGKGIFIRKPENYYLDDACTKISMSWCSTGNLIYMNWLNHYVYQITPYLI
ncbi:MAG TPA: homoserine O-succinyltransferase [Spirochaetaceae bacterium]|nr:homoserine O-succinyltransferase [Spirochaetaceae bacterium]